MPEGLLDTLTKEEILDLLAFIEAGWKRRSSELPSKHMIQRVISIVKRRGFHFLTIRDILDGWRQRSRKGFYMSDSEQPQEQGDQSSVRTQHLSARIPDGCQSRRVQHRRHCHDRRYGVHFGFRAKHRSPSSNRRTNRNAARCVAAIYRRPEEEPRIVHPAFWSTAGNAQTAATTTATTAAVPTPQEIYDDLKLPDEILSGSYANGVMIGHSAAEFNMDFLTNFFPNSAVSSRVFMSAAQVPRLLESLSGTFSQFQQRVQQQQQTGQQNPATTIRRSTESPRGSTASTQLCSDRVGKKTKLWRVC